MHYTSTLPSIPLQDMRVIVRADLNVPITDGIIVDDYRLEALRPTIDLILKKRGLITLITHIGRPKNQEPELSTKILVPWFAKHGYTVSWAANIAQAQSLIAKHQNSFVILENLRFYPEEKSKDLLFAQQLKTLGDFYVNDAFATLHRDDTSITMLPSLFSHDRKTIGLLVEKELNALDPLLTNPQKPYTVVLGGGKVHDKLPVIEHLLAHVSTILLCPALSNTVLKAMGQTTGISLVDQTALSLCNAIIQKAQELSIPLLYPLDYLIALDTINGPLSYVDAEKFPARGLALSIGPRTVEHYASIIKNSRTIFFNAAMGFRAIPKSQQSGYDLLRAIASSSAYSVVGGGDSVAMVHEIGLEHSISFLSTGGGATLTYLSGKELPGLKAIYEK